MNALSTSERAAEQRITEFLFVVTVLNLILDMIVSTVTTVHHGENKIAQSSWLDISSYYCN
jgi:hypothetical protein